MIKMPQTLEEAEAYIKSLDPEARDALVQSVAHVAEKPWIPQPGPQAEAFDHPADEVLYGGAAGGGKSDLVLGLATTQHLRSLIFRRQATDLDGLWERLTELLKDRGLIREQNSVKKRMVMTDGRLIEMGHLEQPGSEKSWQGRPHDLIAFDEAAQLDEAKIMFVTQWLRTVTPGQRCRVLFATNPPIPDMRGGEIVDVSTGDWMKRWFAPWIDPDFRDKAAPGEIRWCVMKREADRFHTIWVEGPGWYVIESGEKWHEADPSDETINANGLGKASSRTFIRSLVQDNVFLRGTGYIERLSSTPEPLRSMLMSGQFGIKLEDHQWQVIPTNWVLAAQERWRERMRLVEEVPSEHRLAPMRVLAADIAQGGMDTTVLAPLREDQTFDRLQTSPGRDTPDGRAVVANLMRVQADQARIVLDGTGGWGGSTQAYLREWHKIEAWMCVASGASHAWTKTGMHRFLNMRAEMWWKFREALDPEGMEHIALPPSDSLLAQLTAPHYGYRGNIIVVEAKEDVVKRLNSSSTDEADAVIMAWHYLPKAIAERYEVDPLSVAEGGWNPGAAARAEQSRGERTAVMDDPLEGWDL